MLKRFELRNYKNFKDTIDISFDKVGGYKFNQECVSAGLVSKAIVYGRNATGKTNLGRAISDIQGIVTGREGHRRNEILLNADSKGKYSSFHYEFVFDGKEVTYEYFRNQAGELKKEILIIDAKCIFELDIDSASFNKLSLEQIDAQTIQFDKYLESINHEGIGVGNEENLQVPFLRFVLNNSALMPESVLKKMETFIIGMRFSSVNQQMMVRRMMPGSIFVDYLNEKDNLADFQNFLNVMGIDCELCTAPLPEGHYELYFNYKKPVPFFENASSGTLSLVQFYRQYIASNRKASFIYLDEFDAFYHYEMAEMLVKYFKKYFIKCQVVMTTHNTNLMTNYLMRPDCVFILSRNGHFTSLCDATERELREGHNLEKLYIGGEFEQYE